MTRYPSSIKDKYKLYIQLPDKPCPMLCHKIADPIKNLFQMDMDQKDSWYSLTSEITHGDRPAVFTPKDISPFTTQKFPQSAKAGMYTKGQLSEFWDAILRSSASKNALQKFTRNLIVPSNAKKGPDGYTYYSPRTDFFVDNMISPNYFENKFVLLGPLATGSRNVESGLLYSSSLN